MTSHTSPATAGTPLKSSTARTPESAARALQRLVIASTFGSAIEQYDFFCYAFIAPIAFGATFFPKMDALAGNLAVYATFAAGFAARPIGGIVFGHYGDRIGRKVVLMLTLLIMGIVSFLIGCLPTYASAGLWAPAILVLLRFAQGFAFGGEYMNAVTLTLEGAPVGHRGLYASFINAAGPLGVIAASGVIAMLTGVFGNQAFQEWGWRIPFLLSVLLVAIGTYMRSHVDESLLFEKVKASHHISSVPFIEVLRSWKLETLFSMLINMVQSSFLYLCAVFVLGYAVKSLSMPASGVITGTTIANVVEMLTVPLIGLFSDRFGRRPVMLLGIVLAAIWFPMFFQILAMRDVVLLAGAMVISVGFIHALMFAPEAAFTAELFPTEVRVSGGSMGKQLGIVFGGGCAPLIATALMKGGTSFTPVIVYFEVIAVCALLGVLFAPESSRKNL